MSKVINIGLKSPAGITLETAGTYCDADIVVVPTLEDKVVTLSEEGQVILPGEGFAGLRQVTVPAAAVPSLQEKTAIENGEYTADSGYDGLSKVTVDVPNVIPEGYVIPKGTTSITENGTHNVSGYANAEVNVPNVIPEGYIKPSGTFKVTVNGTHNVNNYANVEVNVPTGSGTGECSGNHIIEVDTLPTENIDENAVYLCGGAYYKYAKQFVDFVQDGASFRELADAFGIPILFEVVSTKPTAFDGVEMAVYYVEDEDSFYMYEPSTGLGKAEEDVIVVESVEDAGDEGFYAVIQNGLKKYVSPAGTLAITGNGKHDVAEYASVNVNVPIPDGYIQPEGTKNITTNGTHDVTKYASASVSVPTTYIVPTQDDLPADAPAGSLAIVVGGN